jgi:hypothetical protein
VKYGLSEESQEEKNCGMLPGVVIGAAAGFAVLSTLIAVKPEHIVGGLAARSRERTEVAKAEAKAKKS